MSTVSGEGISCDPWTVEIVEVTEVTPALIKAFVKLTPQLSSSNPPPSPEVLAEIVEAGSTILFAAVHEDQIVGALTLATYRIPTGLRAHIEDVVVDGDARGMGVGRALSEAAIEAARAQGCTTVDLTSRPSREAANRLYQRIGFEKRDTNVYRFKLEQVLPSTD